MEVKIVIDNVAYLIKSKSQEDLMNKIAEIKNKNKSEVTKIENNQTNNQTN